MNGPNKVKVPIVRISLTEEEAPIVLEYDT